MLEIREAGFFKERQLASGVPFLVTSQEWPLLECQGKTY